MLGLNKAIDQLAMANSVCWHGNELRREDCRFLRRALDYEVEDQRKKVRLKSTWKNQFEEISIKVGFKMEDALCRSK